MHKIKKPKKNRKIYWPLIAGIALIAIVFYFTTNTPTVTELNYSYVPYDNIGVISLITELEYGPNMDQKMHNLSIVADLVPLTVFVTSHPANGSFRALVDTTPLTGIGLLSHLSEDFELASMGYAAFDYSKMSYDYQEHYQREVRKHYYNMNYTVIGFLPTKFSFDYNTILATENTNYEYMIAPIASKSPIHARAPGDLVLSLLIYPLVYSFDSLNKTDMVNALYIPRENLISARETGELNPLIDEYSQWKFSTLRSQTEYMRTIEESTANINIDKNKNKAYLTTTTELPQARLDILTTIDILNITDRKNATINFKKIDRGWAVMVTNGTNQYTLDIK
ncbi:hypothetical protein K9M79_06605 [Candidatus Woesearchaeota archaeon]|nr:hypothetical protein [Candidatus Woesearchaeota archaeon]